MNNSMTTTQTTTHAAASEAHARWAVAVAMVVDMTWKVVVAVDPGMDRERVVECACAAASSWCAKTGQDRREMAMAVMKSWDEGSVGQMREVVSTVADVVGRR